MLELPEVETLKRDLERDTVGRKVKAAEIKGLKIMPRHRTKKLFTDLLIGAKVESVERRALALVLHLSNEHSLVIELLGSAGLHRNAAKDALEPHTVLSIAFTQGGDLRLVDPGSDSRVAIVPDEELPELLPNAGGLDLLAKPISWVIFEHYMKGFDRPLKSVLTDPSAFVGIGDIYSDEILFEASLRYDRTGNSLNTQEVRRFFRSVVTVLNDAVKYRGTTIDAAPFVDPAGNPGSFQDHLQVFGKHGELSPRSRQPLVRSKFAGRWTYYCDQSQV